MGSAFLRVYVIGKCKDILLVAVVVLQRNLDRSPILSFFKINCLVQRSFVLVEEFHKRNYAPVILKILLLVLPFINQVYLEAFVQKSKLPQPA